MVLDTSALVAILQNELEADAYMEAIKLAPKVFMSLASWLEAAIVVDCRNDALKSMRFDRIVREFGLVLEPVTPEQAAIARQAYRDYGKGRHPAGLNFADCFAYALAKSLRQPLLFKGSDFRQTDVEPAL